MADVNPITIFRTILTKPMYYIFFSMVTVFSYVVFDKNFADIFIAFLFISAFTYVFSIIAKKPFLTIGINTVSGNTGKAFSQGLLAFALFIGVSFVILQVLQPEGFVGIQSILDRIAQTSLGATPILQGNSLAILFVGGLLIPIVETELFFVTLPQVFGNVFNVPLQLTNPTTWIMMGVIAGIFTLYHIEAKGIADNVAWLLTFIFGLFQGWLVLKFREGESAIHMHIQNNFIGIAQRLFLKPIGG